MNHTIIVYKIEYTISLFLKVQYAFIPQDGQMLGNIALACANLLNYVLDANWVATDYA